MVIGKVNKLMNSLSRVRFRIGLLVVGMTALALPAAASAQSPTESQYSSNLDFVAQSSAGGGPGSSGAAGSAASDPSGLPFTGLDVGLLAVVAGALLIAGLMLRRQRPTN